MKQSLKKVERGSFNQLQRRVVADAERAMLFLSGRTGVHEYVPVHATVLHVSMFIIVATNGWNSPIMEPRESAAIVQVNAIPRCTFVREDPRASWVSNRLLACSQQTIVPAFRKNSKYTEAHALPKRNMFHARTVTVVTGSDQLGS
jgi:hypothetical protein